MLDEKQQVRFTRLWTETQPAVTAYVRAIVRDSHAANDVVQNTAVVLLAKFEQWDSTRSFLPWALGFAKFEILAHRRDAGRNRLVFDDALIESLTLCWPGVLTEVDREQTALQECLETLAPKAREIVRLRYFDDLKMPRVAQHTGSTPGAVRIAMMRIRKQLQDCIHRRLSLAGGGT